MAKYYGKIGFAISEETKPGVWTDRIIEKIYSGEIQNVYRRWEKSEYLNDDLRYNIELSMLCDSFVIENGHKIKYIVYAGSKWKANSINIEYPRVKITLGGLYE